MRLVCIDHYFEQDIEALREAAGEHRCWSVGYETFMNLAHKFFPDEVFTGIEAYFRPEHEAARAAYRQVVDRELARLYASYRFDALLAPSDTFFWIRSLIEASQQLEIPFVVLQKEATIPPGWLEGPAQEWGRISPFIADHMLVSSEHHRDFWVNSGVEPHRITVTGQPRFDIYARREGHDRLSDRPSVLFLTYDVNAYLPVIDRTGLEPWRTLRTETEAVLLELAREGIVEVFVKAHPQPAEDQRAHLAELAHEPDVRILDPRGDVRHYILGADAVVGFQTTALLESLAARRPTIYTSWTDEVERYEADLIPFHREGNALVVADSPAALREAIERSASGHADPSAATGDALVTQYLGPVDGQAAKRSWEQLERLVPGAPQRRSRPRPTAAVSAAGAAAVWTVARALSPVSYAAYQLLKRARGVPSLSRDAFIDQLEARRRVAVERLIAASTR